MNGKMKEEKSQELQKLSPRGLNAPFERFDLRSDSGFLKERDRLFDGYLPRQWWHQLHLGGPGALGGHHLLPFAGKSPNVERWQARNKGRVAMKQGAILLVDDEQLIVDSLARELICEWGDLTVARALGGNEAIDRINNGCFDLVVTDLLMPETDGFQVLEAAKRKDAQTMVIILTGYADLEAAIAALRLGADDFLQKSCDPDELLWRIASCLDKQELQRKIAFYENILPMCSYCRKIRDDQPGAPGEGNWYSLEEYLDRVKGVSVSHGCCPECFNREVLSQLPNKRP